MRSMVHYGERDELKELAMRIRRFLPNGHIMTDDEALAVAQVGVSYELNPFNGEVYGLKDPKTQSWRGVMVGIEGARKAARRVCPHYRIIQRLMTAEEVKLRELEQGDIGSLTDLYRIDGAVMPGTDIPFVGEGISKKGDRVPNGRSRVWLAHKRSEADALRKAFDLPFAIVDRGPMDPEVEVVEGEVHAFEDTVSVTELAAKLGDLAQHPTIKYEIAGPADSDLTAQEAIDELYGED